jgi:DNA mismatch repair protein MutS
MVEESGIQIAAGRHPVVEALDVGEEFVPNDCRLGGDAPSFAIITGPNMAGKSTYCRQVALIVLLAQMGSFVPASSARLGLVDRIFTRIGASDELSAGRSTFLVEMDETANILNHASPGSLIILDEIGRGTSTYDGLSLAWAVAEHIVREIGALTLFATHYHELIGLETTLPGVANYSIAVREVGEDIIFLRKVSRGAVDRSYGIQVARLAGLPPTVIQRAREILHSLETSSARDEVAYARTAPTQMVLFEPAESEIERELASLDLMNLTPLEALNKLHDLQKRARTGRR